MLKMLQRLALILMVLIAAGGCGEESPGSPLEQARVVPYDSQAPLRIFLTDLAEHYQLPAIAAAIVHPDGRIETAMVGQNRAVGGAPLASDSVFHIGSCGKSITALLAATFVEQGALSWDTSVNDVFPEIDRASSRVRAGVSLRELLSHTAGIEPFTSDQDVFGADSELAAFSGPLEEARRSFALWLLAQPLFGEVGEFHYSNAGYAIVAAMLEEVSGKPFEQLVQERIFGPLGLESAIVGFAVYSDPGEPWRHLERDVRGVGVPLARNERQYPAVLNPAGNISM